MSDPSEIEQLYRTYGPSVLRRARSILGDPQAASDALQEVFVLAMKGKSEFRGDASVATWLYKITTHYCLNQIRNAARRRELLATTMPPPEAIAATAETKVSLAQILAHVPDELSEIAIYYFVDQMNQDEIAGLLGVSRRTVGNRLEEFKRIASDATTLERVG